jgi:DNA-binding NarL/FixJ family response regulator
MRVMILSMHQNEEYVRQALRNAALRGLPAQGRRAAGARASP